MDGVEVTRPCHVRSERRATGACLDVIGSGTRASISRQVISASHLGEDLGACRPYEEHAAKPPGGCRVAITRRWRREWRHECAKLLVRAREA